MAIQLLKLYLELNIYRCRNDENTPKNGEFYRKNTTLKIIEKYTLKR